jgi:hypothetical protein
MTPIATAFLAEMAIITWRNLHNQKTLPPPNQYAGAAVIFGLLGLAPEVARRGAGAFGWALVVATFVNLWNPNTPFNLTTKAAGLGNPSGKGLNTGSGSPATAETGGSAGQYMGENKSQLQPGSHPGR